LSLIVRRSDVNERIAILPNSDFFMIVQSTARKEWKAKAQIYKKGLLNKHNALANAKDIYLKLVASNPGLEESAIKMMMKEKTNTMTQKLKSDMKRVRFDSFIIDV